ncbi:MAG: ATPase V [Spirochaetales bacterium]|nr:ATPase V [Spirochaetales bacterium]
MIFTQSMSHLTALVLKKDGEACTKALLDLGLLDFVEIRELPGGSDNRISPGVINEQEGRLTETRKRLETFIRAAESPSWVPPVLSVDNLKDFSIDQTEKELDTFTAGLQEKKERQRVLQQEILRMEEMARQLALYGSVGDHIGAASESGYLAFLSGTVPSGNADAMEAAFNDMPSVVLRLGVHDNDTAFLVIVMKKDEPRADRLLSGFSWQSQPLDRQHSGEEVKTGALGELKGRIASVRDAQKKIEQDIDGAMKARLPWMKETWQLLRTKELYFSMQDHFSSTDRTILFSGWVPASRQKDMEKAIRDASHSVCALDWQKADEVNHLTEGAVKAPVKLDNPKALKPFEMLVTNYAVPEYGTIDPTFFVAAAYLIMFGLMFGDAGHGLVLVLLGTLLHRFTSAAKEGMKNLARLIQYCGFSAVAAGILFGSYFGLPAAPPLWFNFHALVAGHSSGNPNYTSIYSILLITIYFGIGVIGTGLVLNWTNLLRKGRWMHLIFDKGGLVGGWMYAFGVYTGFFFAKSSYRELPSASILLVGFALPALVLLIKEPMEHLLHRKHGQKRKVNIMTWVMEWIVELLEIFSGYLANTLSFMRVAGLGIAHVSLMMAFSQIAVSTTGSLANPLGLLIYIAGNVLVIALEGLSAGIQSLRLNYYEFFSKYFTGAGKAYMPISLKDRIE